MEPRGTSVAAPCGMVLRGRDKRVLAGVVLGLAAACSSEDGPTGRTEARAPTDPATSDDGSEAGEAPASGGAAGDASRAVNHVLSTGQSNAIGFRASPVLSTAQPYGNLSFDVGVMTSGACDADGCRSYQTPSGFVPLVEGDSYDAGPVETMSSAFANLASRLATDRDAKAPHDVLVSVHGRSGWVYECLRKGSCTYRTEVGYSAPFEEGLRQVDDAMALAKAAGRSYVVRAVTAVHGESDHYIPTFPLVGSDGAKDSVRTYTDALLEWQRDYDQEIRAKTGQTQEVPLLVSQMANWNDRVTSEIPLRQLEAHLRAPGKVVLATPTYALPFGADCIHFTSQGQQLLGEYFAKAYARIVIEGAPWEPLRPASATLDRDVVTVRYLVPKPPLVLDTQAVTDPGGMGFVIDDGSGSPPAVVGVELAGTDTVRIRLAYPPTGSQKRLRYALEAKPGTCPGPKSGPRGNVRDSDAVTGEVARALPNWSVAFDLPLP